MTFKVGDRIKMKDGVILLVGDVNELLGVCDCCHAYRPDDIVEVISNDPDSRTPSTD